ncbi:MAG: hypothetical protein CFE46_14255 [Burkholderiales bacterium PBB6]|nr:MAG: hypothetical protein CFE46_14255 [Burkholderiales bacterium PBB6]
MKSNHRRPAAHVVLAALIAFGAGVARAESQDAANAPAKPGIGMALKVETEGLLGLTVAKVVVSEVKPGSQAEAAGVLAGDQIVRVEGQQVPGGNALSLRPHMNFVPGEPKKIVFRHPSGTEFEVTLVKPKT